MSAITSGQPRIDLNADCGESLTSWSMPDGAEILEVVSSANVACGFHAGDPSVARETCRIASQRGAVIGAHVSYDDLKGFGRRFIDVVPSELTDQVIYQIGALQACARSVGAQVRYVKPHGALYNTIVHHEAHAGAVVRALAELGDELPILVLPDSEIERQAAAAGIPTVREAFADRAYTPEGRLVSRRVEGSVLHDPAEISVRVVQMATQRTVTAIDGSTISVDAESICVHGDTPGALEIARQVSAALSKAGVEQRSFLS
ncbi:LamB/YcsF family protein [Kocuria palustris]|uniref:LamB/YcsF family protein n=1 Tax=Kocuria palustris TaxID=71999 RepID=UPI0024697274|nr:5-oxoprolinase subunit PxpA [Kocuria palustris]MDH5150662.1 LamB/YcsF family protein [Kocuria palustris]